jgi:hypothetical protein
MTTVCSWFVADCAKAQSAANLSTAATVISGLAAPPPDSRPMMRWWWFGPSVVDSELSRELHGMQAAGIGGVEIQPVYALALDDPKHGIRNLPYLSPDFLDRVHFAATTARALGMRVDITLGSGWPYGGPGTSLALSAGRLKLVTLPASGSPIALPAPADGDTLIAAFSAAGTPDHWQPAGAERLPLEPGVTSISLPAEHPGVVLLFYSSHTRQQVKRAAVGAEGLVLDHFSRPAIDEHLRDVADKLASAFGSQPPYSVFSDSLEVYGSDWTLDLPQQFLRLRGYDVIPHLPELYAGGTAQAAAVRNDWGRTLSDLVRENYLMPINQWAEEHHTLFRSQTYGEPAVTLADEAVPALPEGEGPQWRQFSFTRWATSASHLYGCPITSAETFTWLHSPVFRATPLDMKVEVDRMFLSGVNQIIGHGWPYTPPGIPEPGWNLYAAAVFNDHNPWFAVMPDVAEYMHRGSWLLRQGEPANDIALLLPEEDAQASFTPGHVSVTDEMKKLITPELMSTLLDAGYNVDFVDAATVTKLGRISYPVVVLPPVERMPASAGELLAAYVRGGGHLIAVGTLPHLAPGLEHAGDSTSVKEQMKALFAAGGNAQALHSIMELPDALYRALPPDLASTQMPDSAHAGKDADAGLGFIHRKLHDGDLYFVVNSSSAPLLTKLTFRAPHVSTIQLSLDTGRAQRIADGAPIEVEFAPYGSTAFLLTKSPPDDPVLEKFDAESPMHTQQLQWTLEFPGTPAQPLTRFVSWNTLPGRKFYSGGAVYRTTVHMESGHAQAPVQDESLVLNFGKGTRLVDTREPGSAGIHALLDPPIREAAVVSVNGLRAGSIWHPPYEIDLTRLLHPGDNVVEVHVYNTAVNELAGQPSRDYTALNLKYGKRFDPQDMDQVQSLPSGLLTAPELIVRGNQATSQTQTGRGSP